MFLSRADHKKRMVKSKMKQMTVMVVEDNTGTRTLIKRLLEVKGHRVVESADGKQAVERSWSEHPDLIIMDLSLPVMDGLAAIHELRKHSGMQCVPILVLTAYGSAEIQTGALALGANAFLEKPFDADELEKIVEHLLPPNI
jgi:CheY-like chemotaxis protein